MYCASGLAYPINKYEARCASFNYMKFDGSKISEPYKCNPTNPKKKCELHIAINEDDQKDTAIMDYVKGRDFVENDCKCALDGIVDSGYCSMIIGTEQYEKAVGAHQHMMSAS